MSITAQDARTMMRYGREYTLTRREGEYAGDILEEAATMLLLADEREEVQQLLREWNEGVRNNALDQTEVEEVNQNLIDLYKALRD